MRCAISVARVEIFLLCLSVERVWYSALYAPGTFRPVGRCMELDGMVRPGFVELLCCVAVFPPPL